LQDYFQTLHQVFAPDGVLAQEDPAYLWREQQWKMAQAVGQALLDKATLVAEAGTGVGKTYAYLVPLLLSGRRALVSTATKGLQDQLFWRDLPWLVQALQRPVTLALLKGRSSYLCMHRLQQTQEVHTSADRFILATLQRISRWAPSTKTGDLSELDGLDERSAAIPLVTSTRDNCLGTACPQFNECHLVQARRQAMAADVVVINHHLFFADRSLRETGMAEILPTVDAVILDEAHQLLDVGVQFLAQYLGSGQIRDFAQDVLAMGLEHAKGLQPWQEWSLQCEQNLQALRLAAAGHGHRPTDAAVRIRWQDRASGRADAHARPMEVAFAEALAQMHQCLHSIEQSLQIVAAISPDLEKLWQRARELFKLVGLFQAPVGVDRVRWIDISSHQHFKLMDSPLDIREMFTRDRMHEGKAWILTSATLGDDAELSWFVRSAGLDGCRTLRVGSPYDYARNARLWIPPGLPAPSTSQHPLAVAEVAAPLAAVLGGRTFVLATTLRVLPIIAQQLKTYFQQQGLAIEVLVQGSHTKRYLLEQFMSYSTGASKPPGATLDAHYQGAVLVGSQSFWEGIDVSGDALQCVVIDKLPFPSPDDPLIEARSRRAKALGRDAFHECYLAEAILALKQGAGRLIRSESDQGLLVIADNRLLEKKYGKSLIQALPPMTKLDSLEAAKEWLESIRHQSVNA
jgi:ATP-dependent DNA helicase DinG